MKFLTAMTSSIGACLAIVVLTGSVPACGPSSDTQRQLRTEQRWQAIDTIKEKIDNLGRGKPVSSVEAEARPLFLQLEDMYRKYPDIRKGLGVMISRWDIDKPNSEAIPDGCEKGYVGLLCAMTKGDGHSPHAVNKLTSMRMTRFDFKSKPDLQWEDTESLWDYLAVEGDGMPLAERWEAVRGRCEYDRKNKVWRVKE